MSPDERKAYALGAQHAIEALQVKLLGERIPPTLAFQEAHRHLDALCVWASQDTDAPPPHARVTREVTP